MLRQNFRIGSFAGIISAHLAVMIAGAVAAEENPPASPPDWLIGCWLTQEENRYIEETWAKSRLGPVYFGASVTAVGTGNDHDREIRFFEQLRIDHTDGHWQLHAYPRGLGPTTFTASKLGTQQLVFTNLDNDFPQEISYRRMKDTLYATISQHDGSRATSWRYSQCKD